MSTQITCYHLTECFMFTKHVKEESIEVEYMFPLFNEQYFITYEEGYSNRMFP